VVAEVVEAKVREPGDARRPAEGPADVLRAPGAAIGLREDPRGTMMALELRRSRNPSHRQTASTQTARGGTIAGRRSETMWFWDSQASVPDPLAGR
jgi:hypothetical protein